MNVSTLTPVPGTSPVPGTGANAEPRTGRRPVLLDLFCGGGGASAGYHAAGFDVVGVDIAPQPDYPFPFILADALTVELTGFDVVHASPPCQRFSTATPADRRDTHPDLIAPIRDRLQTAAAAPGGPHAWVIENVPGAPLHDPVTLCGDALRLGVRRHRLFESNMPLSGTPCWHDRATPPVPVYGTYGQRRRGDTATRTGDARTAMGIDWLPWPALTQAIPPAYTHWIGVQLLATLTTHRACGAGVTSAETVAVRTSPGEVTPPAGIRHDPSPTGDVIPSTGIRHGSLAASVAGVSVPARRCGNPACGNPLPARPATGRWPRYCCHACRQAAYRHRSAARGQP